MKTEAPKRAQFRSGVGFSQGCGEFISAGIIQRLLCPRQSRRQAVSTFAENKRPKTCGTPVERTARKGWKSSHLRSREISMVDLQRIRLKCFADSGFAISRNVPSIVEII